MLRHSKHIFMLMLLTMSLIVLASLLSGTAASPGVGDNSGVNDDGQWEVGALWINDYDNACCDCTAQTLVCCDDGASKLIQVLASNGFTQRFNLGDCNAWSTHLIDESSGGLDRYYADGVDLLLVSGHGSPLGFQFCVGCSVGPSVTRLGDNDLEWVIFDACEILSTVAEDIASSPWNNVFNGLHAMLGFNTTVPDADMECFLGICIPVCGEREELFAKYLVQGYDVINAWRRATIESIKDSSVWAGGYGPWDPATQSYGIYDAPYADPPFIINDVPNPQYFMGMFWRCG